MKKLSVLAIAFLATALWAQGPGPMAGPRRGPGGLGAGPQAAAAAQAGTALVQYLGLTDQQMEQIRQARQSFMESTQSTRQELREVNQKLRELVRSKGDATEIANLIQTQRKLQQQLQQSRESLKQNTLALLTADQKSKLAALTEALKLMPAARQALAWGLIDAPEGTQPLGVAPAPQRMLRRGAAAQ